MSQTQLRNIKSPWTPQTPCRTRHCYGTAKSPSALRPLSVLGDHHEEIIETVAYTCGDCNKTTFLTTADARKEEPMQPVDDISPSKFALGAVAFAVFAVLAMMVGFMFAVV